MLALFDEATRQGPQGLYYAVATVVVVSDVAAARSLVAGTIPDDRKRSWFHWHQEGVDARLRMIEAMAELAVTARLAVHYPTGRRRQEESRAKVIGHLVEHLAYDGVTSLVFESRDSLDRENLDWRDRATALAVLRQLDLEHSVRYEHRGKEEPLLWMADAVVGATAQWLLQDEPDWFEKLAAVGVVQAPPTFLA